MNKGRTDCKPKPMNSPTLILREEIRQTGPVSFARFMELALYAPGCGYYERNPAIGRGGDFFTSVSVGPVFGEMLAFQFAQWLTQIEPPPLPAKFQIVEAGAHNGQLALDILTWLRRWRPHLEVEYCLIEPSPPRRANQEELLRDKFPNVRWVEDIGHLGTGVCGVIFSNELLDAMPAHSLSWDAPGRKWRERLVDFEGDEFVWRLAAPSPDLAAFLPEVPAEVEISPAAIQWWTRSANSLHRGKLLTLDYGFDADEWLRPERSLGTLRAYHGHRISENVLANPGAQDITAHVDFSAVREAGERTGLRSEFLTRQSVFLTDILQHTRAPGSGLDEWPSPRVRQFQTLTHPEHLGHRFRALLQSR
jgi:SAM-dependent MidA family methyltransferase